MGAPFVSPQAAAWNMSALSGMPVYMQKAGGGDDGTGGYFQSLTTHREFSDTMHSPWMGERQRWILIEMVLTHSMGVDERPAYKIFPMRQVETPEVHIVRTEYPVVDARPAPEHQPVELVPTRGGGFKISARRWGLGFKVGSLWGSQPGSMEEIMYGINQVKQGFLLRGEIMIYEALRNVPDIFTQRPGIPNTYGDMQAEELVKIEAGMFGAVTKWRKPIPGLFIEASHVSNAREIELDTLILQRNSIAFIAARLTEGPNAKVTDIGETAVRAGMNPRGNQGYVTGGTTTYESRRIEELFPVIRSTEPLAQQARIGTFWVFDDDRSVGPSTPDELKVGIEVLDNGEADAMKLISLRDMRANALYSHKGGPASGSACKFIVMRPNHQCLMSSAIVTRMGGDVGFTLMCNEGVEHSHDGDREWSKYSMRMHLSPVITQADLIVRIPNVAYVPFGYIAGGGVKIHNMNGHGARPEMALFHAGRGDTSRCDLVIVAIDPDAEVPDHFYPYRTWGEDGQPCNFAETYIAYDEIFGNTKILDPREICSPTIETIEAGNYRVPLSRGYCRRYKLDASSALVVEAIEGCGKTGIRDGRGYRTAREMRNNHASPFIIEDTVDPSSEVRRL
jgi:hypothetical protein